MFWVLPIFTAIFFAVVNPYIGTWGYCAFFYVLLCVIAEFAIRSKVSIPIRRIATALRKIANSWERIISVIACGYVITIVSVWRQATKEKDRLEITRVIDVFEKGNQLLISKMLIVAVIALILMSVLCVYLRKNYLMHSHSREHYIGSFPFVALVISTVIGLMNQYVGWLSIPVHIIAATAFILFGSVMWAYRYSQLQSGGRYGKMAYYILNKFAGIPHLNIVLTILETLLFLLVVIVPIGLEFRISSTEHAVISTEYNVVLLVLLVMCNSCVVSSYRKAKGHIMMVKKNLS